MPDRVRHIVGCMTGTSIDALDAAIVRVEGDGLAMRTTFVRGHTEPLGDLAPRLRALADQQPMSAGDIATLAHEFAILHAQAVGTLSREAGLRSDLIAVHGQTVFHAPPVSWQLFDPAPLVEALGVPVVFDLRAADLARGGQGAPITPIADFVLFSHEQEARAIVNLGGFCNVTLLPAVAPADRTPASIVGILGFDLCTCNHLLNAIARKLLNTDYDDGGRAALSGQVLPDALEDLMGVLASQSRPTSTSSSPRSLGTGDEALDWVSRYRAHASAHDIAATACEALGQSIGRAITDRATDTGRILLAGGGARNAALVGAISGWASAKVSTVTDFGIPIEFREAACMAVLGALCQDRVPLTLPQVTGLRGKAPLAGTWAFYEPGA